MKQITQFFFGRWKSDFKENMFKQGDSSKSEFASLQQVLRLSELVFCLTETRFIKEILNSYQWRKTGEQYFSSLHPK